MRHDPLTVLAEPRRREILLLVWERELAAGDIARAFDVTFSAVSQHLARLRAGGLVHQRRAGRHRYYRARREALGALTPYIEDAWRSRLLRLKDLAEGEELAGEGEQE